MAKDPETGRASGIAEIEKIAFLYGEIVARGIGCVGDARLGLGRTLCPVEDDALEGQAGGDFDHGIGCAGG